MSQHGEGAALARAKRHVELGIFLVGLVGLMVELLHTRMPSFFLGSISNFLAIPVALFGLALGSLLVHRERKGRRPSKIRRTHPGRGPCARNPQKLPPPL